MTHVEFEPGVSCPGRLRADRYRHQPNERTHKWRCSVCGRHFIGPRGRITPTGWVPAELLAKRIKRAQEVES